VAEKTLMTSYGVGSLQPEQVSLKDWVLQNWGQTASTQSSQDTQVQEDVTGYYTYYVPTLNTQELGNEYLASVLYMAGYSPQQIASILSSQSGSQVTVEQVQQMLSSPFAQYVQNNFNDQQVLSYFASLNSPQSGGVISATANSLLSQQIQKSLASDFQNLANQFVSQNQNNQSVLDQYISQQRVTEVITPTSYSVPTNQYQLTTLGNSIMQEQAPLFLQNLVGGVVDSLIKSGGNLQSFISNLGNTLTGIVSQTEKIVNNPLMNIPVLITYKAVIEQTPISSQGQKLVGSENGSQVPVQYSIQGTAQSVTYKPESMTFVLKEAPSLGDAWNLLLSLQSLAKQNPGVNVQAVSPEKLPNVPVLNSNVQPGTLVPEPMPNPTRLRVY
jgi:hypothetical protein